MLQDFWNYRSIFFSRFLSCLGILLTIWEISSFFNAIQSLVSANCCKVSIGLFILIISILYAFNSIFCKKKKLELRINKRTQLHVQKGNLMSAHGVKVIPVNEYFDTHCGDGIINPASLHGQFIKHFDGRLAELRQNIDEQLSNIDTLPSNRRRTIVPNLPQKRYPLGTCIRIIDNEDIFLLVAVARFNANEHVDVASEEYPEIIRKMYNGIEQLHDGNPVYIPLVGSGISGYQLTNMQILNTLVQMAHNADKLAITKGIHIFIYGDEQLNSLNLNVIEYLYDRWKTLK